MRAIFLLSCTIIVIMLAGIGCLVIFEVLSFDRGLSFFIKGLAATVLLGAASAAIVFLTKNKNTTSE